MTRNICVTVWGIRQKTANLRYKIQGNSRILSHFCQGITAVQEENQATLLLLKRLIKAQPDAPSGQIANVLAQYSEAVRKDIRPAAKTPRTRKNTPPRD